MPLTRIQRANLRIYQLFRTQDVSITGLIWANRRIYAVTLSVYSLATLAIFWLAGAVMGSVFGSFVLGALLRDLALYRRSVKAWPLLKQIIDWTAVDRYLEEDAAEHGGQ